MRLSNPVCGSAPGLSRIIALTFTISPICERKVGASMQHFLWYRR
jgi:hypothetical protein